MTEILLKPQSPEHFELHHENGETIICMAHDGECVLLVEITDEYTGEEQQQLVASTKRALEAVDRRLEGRTGEVFKGLHIKIGEGLAPGGAEAKPAENTIVLNGRDMLLSLEQMRSVVDSYDDSELRGSAIEEHEPGGALKYTLVHEMGHILDERTVSGQSRHRVAAKESPTRYGREPDEWHSEKDHEAFADGFAHQVYDMPISRTLEAAIEQTIEARLTEAVATNNI